MEQKCNHPARYIPLDEVDLASEGGSGTSITIPKGASFRCSKCGVILRTIEKDFQVKNISVDNGRIYGWTPM